MDVDAIDDLVNQIDLDEVNVNDDENDTIEEWGTMVDESINQDAKSGTNEAVVNIQDAILQTEQQKKDLEMKNAKKMEKDRKVRISQKKRRIRYTPPGEIFFVKMMNILRCLMKNLDENPQTMYS